jgi:hypothetical protein
MATVTGSSRASVAGLMPAPPISPRDHPASEPEMHEGPTGGLHAVNREALFAPALTDATFYYS